MLLRSWVGAVQGQPGSLDEDVIGIMTPLIDRETGEVKTVPNMILCRCGRTQAYYDDENIAMVTDECIVLGCDTDQFTKLLHGERRDVSFYHIPVPGPRTRLIE